MDKHNYDENNGGKILMPNKELSRLEKLVIETCHMPTRMALDYLSSKGVTCSETNYRRCKSNLNTNAKHHLINSANSFKMHHFQRIQKLEWIANEMLQVYNDSKTANDKIKALKAIADHMVMQAAFADATKFVVEADNEIKQIERMPELELNDDL
uniref:Phage protein n=1 Tax=Nitrosopumivirus cobalaminus TaxID=3158414 RepID=A0AAU7N454_9VIRU